MAGPMHLPLGPSALAVALVAAAGLALFQHSSAATAAPTAPRPSSDRAASIDGLGDGIGESAAGGSPALPPNHPPIRSAQGADLPVAPARDETPVITWTAPPGWEVAPSTSSMRLVTYHLPLSAADAGHVEVTVTRAGGTPEANLERWVGQFDGAGPDTRSTRTVNGFRVSTLEVGGTYEGGMTMGGSDKPHPAWALLGAVVETNGLPYFFKLVGPVAVVQAARPAFDKLLGSIRKAP
jgi:hypothetical protein